MAIDSRQTREGSPHEAVARVGLRPLKSPYTAPVAVPKGEDQANRPGYPISSVDNALRLLLAFRERRSIRLSDASALLEVAHSTAHRLLAMLAYHGFVTQEPESKAYIAGPALIEVGLAVVRSMDIRSAVRSTLEHVQSHFGETVHLAVLEGTQVRYLDSIESNHALRVASRTGTTLPAHCTSVGKVLLADLSPERLKSLYPTAASLRGQTPSSITTMPKLLDELRLVAKRGYATNQGESEEDVSSVAVPLRDSKGTALATLSVAAPSSRMSAKRMREIGAYLQQQSDELAPSLQS
jgi:IclR family acetate operon transcriptional repressor